MGGAGGGGARISKFFYYESKFIIKKWMDRQTDPNQFAPSNSSKLGA